MERDVIAAYLAELDRALTVPRRLRRRVLAEAADHLACAAAATGDAAAAVRAFGPPEVVARRFAEELALGSARLAVVAGAIAAALYGALFAAGRGAADPLAWFAVQLAFVCTAVTVLRVWRHRHAAALPAGDLRYVNRGMAVALAAVALGNRSWVALAAVAAAVLLLRAHARTRALATLADEPARGDALGDLAALTGPAEPLADALAELARAHRHRFCALVALAAGLAVSAGHAIGDGPPAPTWGGVLASVIILAIEASAVVVCFAALRRPLGLVT